MSRFYNLLRFNVRSDTHLYTTSEALYVGKFHSCLLITYTKIDHKVYIIFPLLYNISVHSYIKLNTVLLMKNVKLKQKKTKVLVYLT